MTAVIKKWGNSLAVRVPKELAKSLNLVEGKKVTIVQKNNSFEVRPEIAKAKKYSLEKLVSCISAENIHEEIDWGAPVGKEIW